jgi:hypothetical protein
MKPGLDRADIPGPQLAFMGPTNIFRQKLKKYLRDTSNRIDPRISPQEIVQTFGSRLDKFWTLPKTPWEKDLFRPKNGIYEPQSTLVGKGGDESIPIREKPENQKICS